LGISEYHQTVIICDNCNDFTEYPYDKTFTIKKAGEKGWSIGKRTLCPKCKPKWNKRR
jgi:hypothetical protein